MAIKTQGTQLYFLDNKDGKEEIIQIGCPISVSLGDVSVDTIETTCLSATVRSYVTGLESPGEGKIGINLDPANASHMRLYEIQDDKANNEIWLILGLSESTTEPILSNEQVLLAGDRSWLVCKVTINGFPFAIEGNSVIQVEIPIQRSGIVGFKAIGKTEFAGIRFKKEVKDKFIGAEE